MAVYKPTDCVPSGDSFDALNDRPIFIECKIDTNNAVVNGYSLELFDEDNNNLWSADSGTADYSVQQTDNITLVVDLKRFFDDKFSQYGRGYQNLNTGINGSYLKIPIIYDAQPDIGDYGTFSRNTPPESVLSNGKTYRWKITLYQKMVSGDTTTSYPLDQIYYDMIVSTGKVIGSTSQRIQTALVADDDDLVDGLVLIDKYIQPVSIDLLKYNPETPKDWSQDFGNNGIINSGVRSLIENYDDIYGHIYPSQSGDNAFSEDQITLDSGNNGFRIYKNGNDPANLGVSDKVYEIINYPVDMEIAKSELRYYDYNPSEDRTIECDAYINIPASIIVDINNIWVQTSQGNVLQSAFVHEATYGSGENRRREIYITCRALKLIAEHNHYEHMQLFNGIFLYYYAQLPQNNLADVTEYNRWKWIDTPANPSQSHWKQVYTTTTNPSENGYRPFDGYPSGAPSITIYGKERIIFNHMYTGGAYFGSGDDRKYLGSCYNGIFSPDPSAEKVDGENKWNVTINWYRTTDANTWGLLLNKVVYVENGSTTPPDEVDGDVLLQSGANAEITIGSTSGVLNQTPFMFVSEKPVRLFNTVKTNMTDSGLVPTNVGTTNSVYLIETTEPIGEVLSVKINGVIVPSNTWSYIVKSQNVFYTPSNVGDQLTTAEVVYKQYREQDYTGVIFYNQIVDNHNNVSVDSKTKPSASLVYIKPFAGIESHMIVKFDDDKYTNIKLSPISIINTQYWFIIVKDKFNGNDWSPYLNVKNVDTKYQICSNYRDSDYNEFSLAENPELVVHVYDSMGNEISSEEHDDLFYEIKTRTFSAEIEYNQVDYILWESCQWDLYTADRMLDKFVTKEFVTSSSEKYDGRLRFVFFGLEDSKYYILRSTIVTNNGGRFSQDTILRAKYAETSTQGDNTTIDFNYDDLCVEINVSESYLSSGDVVNSMIRIYKREVWYYNDQIKRTDGRFAGDSSPWCLISENALAGVVYKDYGVASGHHYEYLVCRDSMVAVSSEENDSDNAEENDIQHFVSQEIWAQHLDIEVEYMGWSIIELHDPQEIENGRIIAYTASPKDVWRFKYNVSSGAQVQNVARSQQDTLSGYPKISVGEKNFMSGSVSALLGREIIQANYRVDHYKYVPERIVEVDNIPEIAPGYWTRNIDNEVYNAGGYKEELSRWQLPDKNDHYKPVYVNANTLGFRGLSSNESVNMINAWKDVVYSGNDKLMKDEKGRMFLIHIISNSVEPNESWNDMPTQISFDWVEVSDVKNISVYENEPNDNIIIDGLNREDVDENGYVAANKYLGRNGAIKVEIKNPQYINGFGSNAFSGCTNIQDVYIDYPDIPTGYEGPPVEDNLFDWWCKLDFENEAANPINVSLGENKEGVRIKKQESNLGEYILCATLNCSDDLEREQDNSGYIPTKYSVRGYKYLEKVIMKYNAEREITDAGLFEGCAVLQTAELHNVNIVEEMFKDCVSLNDVTFGDISSISDRAFFGCAGLTSFTIPNDCAGNIGECVFTGCNGLTSITTPFIGDGNESQYFGYLFGADNYEGQGAYLPTGGISVSLNTNNNIPDYAFYGCSRLKSVNMSDDIISIGAHAFDGCSGLETITLPGSVTSIGEDAFNGTFNNNKQKMVIYTGSISEWCGIIFTTNSSNPLMYAHNLYVDYGSEFGPELVDYLEIPSGITSLYNYAFCGGTCIKSVVINSDVNSVGLSVFAGCNNIESIDIPLIGDGDENQYFGYLFGAQEYDGQNEYLPENISVVLNGNFNISDYAFYGCSELSAIDTEEWGGSSIGAYAFYGCDGLTAFNIPEVVRSIDDYAFSMSGLTSVTLEYYDSDHHTGTSVGYHVFENCTNLNSAHLKSRQSTTISAYTFAGCSRLQSVVLDIYEPYQLWSIGDYAFYNCQSLDAFDTSDVEEIGSLAFARSGLSSLTISSTITSIGTDAFRGSGVEVVKIIDRSQQLTIGSDAFEMCNVSKVVYLDAVVNSNYVSVDGLFKIVFADVASNPISLSGNLYYTLDNDITERLVQYLIVPSGAVNNYAVYGCTSLIDVLFSDGVTSIGDSAFNSCTNLTIIEFDGATSVSVGNYAFASCSNLIGGSYEGKTLPSVITSVGTYAFANTSIENVYDTLTSVSTGSFAGSSVNYVELSGFTMSSLPASLFSGCSMLSTLKLSDQTMRVGTDALNGCINLTTLWAHVNVIDSFEYKMNLQNVTFYLSDDMHGDVRNVPDDMLNGSTSITSVNIVGTTNISCAIGARAFYNCTNLSNVTINGVYTIWPYAFAYIPADTITITSYVNIIHPGAFVHAWDSEDKAYFPSGSVWKITGGPEQETVITNNHSASVLSQYLRGGYDSAYYSEYTWTRTQ